MTTKRKTCLLGFTLISMSAPRCASAGSQHDVGHDVGLRIHYGIGLPMHVSKTSQLRALTEEGN